MANGSGGYNVRNGTLKRASTLDPSLAKGQVFKSGYGNNLKLFCKTAVNRGKMAEGEGFEPSIRGYPYNDLANRRLQPLGHPSAREWVITTYANLVLPSSNSTVNPTAKVD